MQKKLRHSKFRNTGILFELLTTQVTTDILSGQDNSSAKDLLFKYFKENTELSKEWRMYNSLLNEKTKDNSHAERYLSTILEQRKRLNNKKLTEEKYNLIKEMRDLYPLDEFFKNNIRNYKVLASVYKLFEDSTSTINKFTVNEVFQAKNCIIENITPKTNNVQLNESDDLIKFYKQQTEDVRLLSYKLLIENFNKKYNGLDDDQKLILKEYINNVSNTNGLWKFINSKIDDISIKLEEVSNKITDSDVIKIKIHEVVKQLNKNRPSNGVVKDDQITSLLLSFELLKEIKRHVKTDEAPNEEI